MLELSDPGSALAILGVGSDRAATPTVTSILVKMLTGRAKAENFDVHIRDPEEMGSASNPLVPAACETIRD